MLETKIAEDGQKGLELDLKNFELEIDKEIDSLFVPLENEAEAQAQAAAPTMDIARPQPPAPAAPVSSAEAPAAQTFTVVQAEEITIGFDEPETNGMDGSMAIPADHVVEAQADDFTLIIDTPMDTSNELKQLLESFQASYLSLDWDFSSPNVTALGKELANLEPYCTQASETDSLYKIMKAVLQRVSSRPDTVSPQLVEVMRDAQDLLRRFLLPGDTGVALEDRSRLKELVARVHAIKNAQVRKESKPPTVGMPDQAYSAPMYPSAEFSPTPADFSALEGTENLTDWIGQAQRQLRSTIDGLQDANRRLYQLEEILVSKPALAPLTARIKSVRSNIEHQIASVRHQETSWSRLISVVNERGIRFDAGSEVESALGCEKRAKTDGAFTAGRAMANNPSEYLTPRTQRDQVCIFTLAGRRSAVLSANVVKIQSVNQKKTNGILKRGYGVLKDFKPFFKSIKTGLFGSWIGLPNDVLKKYQFMPLSHDAVSAEPITPDAVQSAILVSNGKHHGIIWSESGAIDIITETIELTSDSKTMMGRIRRDSQEEIQVLNVDHLLKTMHQDDVQS
jgi:hypothetical protein